MFWFTFVYVQVVDSQLSRAEQDVRLQEQSEALRRAQVELDQAQRELVALRRHREACSWIRQEKNSEEKTRQTNSGIILIVASAL